MGKDRFSLRKDKEDPESISLWIESEALELYLLPDKKINQSHPTPFGPASVS